MLIDKRVHWIDIIHSLPPIQSSSCRATTPKPDRTISNIIYYSTPTHSSSPSSKTKLNQTACTISTKPDQPPFQPTISSTQPTVSNFHPCSSVQQPNYIVILHCLMFRQTIWNNSALSQPSMFGTRIAHKSQLACTSRTTPFTACSH